MAIALGNLYHGIHCQVDEYDLANVLMAAYKLEFADLIHHCVDQMRRCINYSNIAPFYSAGVRVSIKLERRNLAQNVNTYCIIAH